MFMLSFRLSRGKVLAALLAVVLVVALGFTAANIIGGGKGSVEAVSGTAEPETPPKGKPKKIPAKTNEQRVEFARTFGWEIQEDPAEILEVIIPKEFDDVYNEYNSMQKQQGFDLTKYAGKRCKRYSYVVTNHPNATGEVRVNILVCDKRVIGGDVCSMEAGGFIHGFSLEG